MNILAQAAGPASKPAPTPGPEWFQALSNPMTLLIIGLVVLYFFVFRTKRTQDKSRKQMLSSLKRGDKVQTIGGIIGTVLEARDTEVLLKVDEGSNTKMRFTRSAVHRVVEDQPEVKK
jgi:preprotein translocase subunit YajC